MSEDLSSLTNIQPLELAFQRLQQTLPQYEERPQQLEMAKAVFRTLNNKSRLLIEAGTGVGKSFAYLVPAILTGKKTIVSTATIALQDQLVHKDLVFLQQTLEQPFSFGILKGKSNYLCRKRELELGLLGGQHEAFRQWSAKTKMGEKDEAPFNLEIWSKVCGDASDCNGRKCPFYSDCFYYRHYKSLYTKDLLVVNHHLLIHDLLAGLRILPFHQQLVVDEAHQLEDIISQVFGNMLSRSRVLWLLRRLRGLNIETDAMQEAMERFFAYKATPSRPICPIPQQLLEGLQQLKGALQLEEVITRLKIFHGAANDSETADRITTTIGLVRNLIRDLDDFIKLKDPEKVYYALKNNRNVLELKSNLVESSQPFKTLEESYEGLVLASATLTVNSSFSFITQRLGLSNFEQQQVGSPFQYSQQALLYLDPNLPPPTPQNEDVFLSQALLVIEGLITASQGRALLLFTSYRQLRYVAEKLNSPHPLKAQGEMLPAKLLRWFKDTPNSVLLGTSTFWQGIDVKGDALSLVIIVKMPFGAPGDPVYDERCRRLGGRWFADLALPAAILQLKQGFGRLIRSGQDRGVIAILDTRFVRSAWGKTAIASLPTMRRVQDLNTVKLFLAGKT